MNDSQFDLALQDEHVRRHGESVEWRKALKCPCGSEPDANRANVNCAACGGYGYVYDPPVLLRAQVTGVGYRSKMLVEAGIAQPGDMLLSLSPLDPTRLADYDLVRVTWPEGQRYEGELVRRGPGATDELKYRPVPGTARLFSVDPSTGAITGYAEGPDWTLAGNVVTWAESGSPPAFVHAPPAAGVYSAKYDVASYDYVCFTTPLQRLERATDLGTRALLQRRQAVMRGSPSP